MQKSSGINDQGNNNEYDYAIFLEKKGLLPGQENANVKQKNL